MNKNTFREIDYLELESLAVVGGGDNDGSITPNAITTPVCAIIATLTVITISAGTITSVK